MSPNLMGFLKETLFTAAVTHMRRLQRWALMAAVMSIQFNRLPPIRFPSVLVSLGMTMRVLEAYVSRGVRCLTMGESLCKVPKPKWISGTHARAFGPRNQKSPSITGGAFPLWIAVPRVWQGISY